MRLRSCAWRLTSFAIIVGAVTATSASATAPRIQNKKPSISLKATPPVGFTPLRVVVTAELKGGANDYEEFYCASVEWDWGDDTKSETKADCDPYEAGKSEIKRRYVQEHTFRSVTSPLTDPGAEFLAGHPVPRQVHAEAEEQARSDPVRPPSRLEPAPTITELPAFRNAASESSSRRPPSGRGRRPCPTGCSRETARRRRGPRADSSARPAASGSSPTPCSRDVRE